MAEAAAPAPTRAPAKKRERSHRKLVDALMALAVIVGVFAVMAVWTDRQALNTDNWTSTSSKLLADQKIQTALGAYLVSQVFNNVDVEGELKSALPPQLQGVAGPVAGGLHEVANRAAPALLATPQVQEAWKRANKAAHQQLIRIINGGGNTVSTKNGEVTLDLHALVAQLAATLGVGSEVAAVQSKLQGGAGASARNTAQQKLGITLPPHTGQLVIMRSSQLKFAQDIAGAIKGLAIVLPLILVGLFVLAVWLARNWRRVALRTAGWSLIGIGLGVLIVRRVAGNAIVDGLVKVDANKPAVHDVWSIATTLLYDIAVALIVYGIVVVVAAWLAGSTRPATAVRRALAPSMRERVVTVYATCAAVFLVLVVWGPTPAFRQLIPLIVFAVLIVVGVETLRRQTAAEFPDAQSGDTMNAIRGRYAERREARAPAAPPTNGAEHVASIERLAALHDRGALSDAEFAAEKATILNGS